MHDHNCSVHWPALSCEQSSLVLTIIQVPSSDAESFLDMHTSLPQYYNTSNSIVDGAIFHTGVRKAGNEVIAISVLIGVFIMYLCGPCISG